MASWIGGTAESSAVRSGAKVIKVSMRYAYRENEHVVAMFSSIS